MRAFLVLLLLSATLGLTHACVHRIKAKNARERKASATSPRLLNNPSSLVHPRIRAFVSSHRSLQIFLEFTVVALPTGFSYLIPSLGASFLRASVVLLLLSLTLLLTLAYVHEIKAKKSLGFDPDYFLSVERRVSEQGCRPEVLIHKPSGHPEFSGWWAYAGDHADGKKDFVKWSVEDLVKHTPEAAVPLRHGHGRWKWNDAQKAYQAI